MIIRNLKYLASLRGGGGNGYGYGGYGDCDGYYGTGSGYSSTLNNSLEVIDDY
jgi:hypothetical protein